MILRFLNVQGIACIAISLALVALFVLQKAETRHWKKQSANFEQLFSQERAAFAGTVANYRAAADAARVADESNAARVAAEQRSINERTAHDYETRLAAARAAAERLRLQSEAAADSGAGRAASMSPILAPPGGAAESAGQDRLPPDDALTATEQAIQLDELIKWVRAQAKVDNNPTAVASPPDDSRRQARGVGDRP